MSAVAAAAIRRPRRPGRRKITNRTLLYLALVFYLAIAVFPLYWMFMAAFKEDVDLIDPGVSPFWFKRPLSLAHFDVLFRHTNFLTWYSNTYVIAAAVLVITLLICVPGAYALARLRMGLLNVGDRARRQFEGVSVGERDARACVASDIGNGSFIRRLAASRRCENGERDGFFKRVPFEIEEAAQVDGCNRWQAVLHVVLPVSVPGILTTAIFAFTLAMQDFVYALTFTSSSSQQPLNVGIPASLIRGDIYFWGELMAAALLAGVPVAILYNFFLDYFVEGITGGALKN